MMEIMVSCTINFYNKNPLKHHTTKTKTKNNVKI